MSTADLKLPSLPLRVGKVTRGWLTFTAVAAVLAVAGFIAWTFQLSKGLEVTGLRDIGTMRGSPWGLYISFDVFFVGVSFAGIATAALIRLLNLEKLRPVARMAEVLTVVSLLLAAIAILADLGQPFRGIINLFRYARPQSPFFGTFTMVIAGYMFASLIFLYLDSRRDAAACATVDGKLQGLHRIWAAGYRDTPAQHSRHERTSFWLAIAILPLLVIAHSTLGFVFGLQAGRPGWYSALQAPAFVIMAGISGIGILTILAAAVRKSLGEEGQKQIGEEVFAWLGRFLMILILTYVYFMIVELLTAMYAGGAHEVKVSDALLKGRYAAIYWVSVAALVVPLGLLLRDAFTRTWRIGNVVACGAIVNIAAIGKRYLLVVPSQTHGPLLPYEPGTYAPSAVEYLIIIGLLALGAVLIAVFLKIFPIIKLPDGHVLGGEADDEPEGSEAEPAGATV